VTVRGLLGAGSALVVLLSGCAAEVFTPHSLTAPEAERLALVRYLNYEARIAAVRATVPTGAGTLVLDGRVDFVDHVGHVAFRTEGRIDPASAGILQWNPALVAFRQGRGQRAEDPPAADGWQLRRLQSEGSELDVVLLVLLNLANDRPDNPQLLRQSSARWLRTDTVDGVEVDVFAGPAEDGETARLTYWVDRDSNLRRLTIRLSGREAEAALSFSPSSVPLVPLPALTTR
jgi:hypothetical protein